MKILKYEGNTELRFLDRVERKNIIKLLYKVILQAVSRNYKLLGLFFSIVILIFLVSCDKSIEVINKPNEFLPLDVGNYWIFKSYETDINGNIINETIAEDSLVIVGTKNINDLSAQVLLRYRNNQLIDTMYLAENKNTIVRLFDSSDIQIPHFTKHWLPIIDYNVKKNYSWNIFNTTLKNYSYQLKDTVYQSVFQHTFNGTFESNDSVTINNDKFLSKKYSNKYDSRLSFQIIKRIDNDDNTYYYDSLYYSRILKYIEYYYLVENIGFLKIEREPYTLKINTSPSSTFDRVENFNGFVNELERYYIKGKPLAF